MDESPLSYDSSENTTFTTLLLPLLLGSVTIVRSQQFRKVSPATVVPGRFELIDQGQDFAVIVDYAHTPDGLENVLTAAKRVAKRNLICVFGCGGDRDNGKRPKMGNISAQIADYSVVTSDNPRTEDPDEIIAQIVSNLPHDTNYVCISERRAAIHHAIATAKSGDVVVIAGKGHEDYQEINGKRFPFDDRGVASTILESL